MPKSLVSIIIPAYNYARYLPQSVASAMQQEDGNIAVEVIIVDDGSTDNTAEVAQGLAGPCVSYIHQQNQGLSAARNTGIRAANGQYLLFLDADDLLAKGTLAAHLDNLASHPSLDISVGPCLCYHPKGSGKGNFLWPLKAQQLELHLCHSNISPVHTFLAKRAIIGQVGLFSTELKACEDQDYWLRCAASGAGFGATTQGLALYRQHEASMTASRPRQLIHDAVLRATTQHLLETVPGFPRAGKCAGWLAHAAGTLSSGIGLFASMRPLAEKLLAQSVAAMLHAAEHFASQKTDDNHVQMALDHFALSILGNASALTSLAIADHRKALAFVGHRFPHLASLPPDALQAREDKLFARLCCDRAACMENVRRLMGGDELLARELC